MLNKSLISLWFLGASALFLYSFTQVDLSLTLSRVSIWQEIQKAFQYVGWFDRPLSTYLYVGIISFLFILFLWTIYLVSKNKINKKTLWTVVILVTAILIPSYNAFSYDLFNYIFDARIVSYYGLNPYEFKPLDFTNDPMLSFMRSTHRVYPYGPVWLLVTVPITFIANEIFLLSFFLLKLLNGIAFLATVHLVKKIAEHLKLKNVHLAIVLFALNPLVLVEGLVSAHNEIIMVFFAVLSLYLLFLNRNTLSVISLIISIGIKYATVVLLPVLFIKMFIKKISDGKIIQISLALLIFAVVATSLASGQNKGSEFQPWYLLLVAPLIALCENRLLRFIFVVLSFIILASYVPFLYNGIWPEDILNYKNMLIVLGVIFGLASYFIFGSKTFSKLHR